MFKIAAIPWGNHMLADPIPTNDPEWTPRNQFKNFWGYEMLMLDEASKFLNFTYQIGFPPDAMWGMITETGEWNGFILELATDEVDFTISDCFVSYLREQVTDGSITFGRDYITLATPRPTYQ